MQEDSTRRVAIGFWIGTSLAAVAALVWLSFYVTWVLYVLVGISIGGSFLVGLMFLLVSRGIRNIISRLSIAEAKVKQLEHFMGYGD